MANVLPRHFVYGAILFTLIIVGGVAMLNEFNNNSASLLAETEHYADFNATFNKFNELNDSVDTLTGSLDKTNPDVKDGTFLGDLIRGSWSTLKTIGTSFEFMSDGFNGLTEFFGVPAWIPALLISLVGIMLVFAIWSAVFQREI